MELVLVVARARNGVIGNAGGMPWHIPADLKHFRRLTIGKPVIMGRKTFDSIGKRLPGRHNIVLTRDPGWCAEGVTTVANLAEAVAAAGLDPRARADAIMVIGGAQIYAEALPSATRIALTEIDAAPAGDTILPPFDPARWRETAREVHPAAGDTPGFAFVTLTRA
ncbi:dihydrofolate reductase [Polymorphobacter fuscus]|uniref:Dihydrofolate reductase n=1 Tax=Sandarakinorhabdus fusca TaxID=1439888 RepID=A0A7C9GYP7_9SPHN|nr:dihydrofolate reductase [Polymorphobacter fuscus]KAB7644839.1 dihydrofolate reductase [Polymorphobacter fuscus]MQT18114.1 dihydrofolate reductase [Polymorphobacter fuscus]NJC09432.1 dihydrofolate reductase [Polymorphobacter fuscus]